MENLKSGNKGDIKKQDNLKSRKVENFFFWKNWKISKVDFLKKIFFGKVDMWKIEKVEKCKSVQVWWMDWLTYRQTDWKTDRQTDKQTDRQTERQTDGRTDRGMDRSMDRRIERQADGKMDRQ